MSDFKLALVIDAQEDFMDPTGALFVPGADQVVPILNDYLASLTLENGYVGVIFTADTHDEETYPNSEEAKEFPPHCYQGTDGFKLAVDPSKVPEETKRMILNKGVFDMWEQPELVLRPYVLEGEPIAYGGEQDRNEWFATLLANGIEEVEVVGVAADYCVKWAVDGLLARGFSVTLYDNLTAGIQRDINQVLAEDWVNEDVRVL